jgi:hypothetical protein
MLMELVFVARIQKLIQAGIHQAGLVSFFGFSLKQFRTVNFRK